METQPNTLVVAPGVELPQSILAFRFSRSSGPGGQNVNKLNTKAMLSVSLKELASHIDPGTLGRLRHLAGSRVTVDDRLVIQCEESRSQVANRAECVIKLRELIVRARVVPKRRRKTKPSRGAKERRLQAKKNRGEIKQSRRERHD